ncbi:hypothetical protein CHS0354_032912 [Potamilus streckersoni]|uniref:FAM20 C-terminal domain-containing protein n=1 Tax=Potamilus streckersoni TaxID=2493646 RepID=A0AAE0RWC7_9BIVA|nr:hypothetical protein CHS0354_032912 [Potamilus streckersoni]
MYASVVIVVCLTFTLYKMEMEFIFRRFSNPSVGPHIRVETMKPEYSYKNISTLWNAMDRLINNQSLYPDGEFVDEAIAALRKSRIIRADIWGARVSTSSYKWQLTLEGGQKVLFKPAIVNITNKERTSDCVSGCEHPQYEITGFTLNRLFKLKNMPYATGRRLSWANEIEPVATDALLNATIVLEDGDVCVKWACYQMRPKTYCFKKGVIEGAIIYWLDNRLVRERYQSKGTAHHEFHVRGRRLDEFQTLMPGEKDFCQEFRQIRTYRKDNTFGHVLDMAVVDYIMLNYDTKHTYIANNCSKAAINLNIIVDYGLSFCPVDDVILLAPIYQCCNIRRKIYDALLKHQFNFTKVFLTATSDDPLFPLLLEQDVIDMHNRLRTILALVNICMKKYGEEGVVLDI